MKANMRLHPSSFNLHPLFSQLWLHEPDADAVLRAVSELGLPEADPTELASAYTDVFLLNVYPYGTAFTDPSGELNGPGAQRLAALYEAHGYSPPELGTVGAPDHVGLCLGFLREWTGLAPGELSLDWVAVCCLAVEREPTANSFYRALAARTREALFAHPALRAAPLANSPILPFSSEEELSLRALLHFVLTPARCGVFLSRSRLGQMAKGLGMRLSFGSRFDVAERLFASAGESGQVEGLIGALNDEVEVWQAEYRAWAEQSPAWRPFAETWLARTADAMRTLAGMQQMVGAERA
jgi:TorA maturation chaperone TorD